MGKYGVILADPPWDYADKGHSRRIDRIYPIMKIDEICALRPMVDKLAARDCVLFLWATAPNLPGAMKVLEEWGFTYKSCAVWDKEIFGMGHYLRIQHELILLGRRGQGTSAVHNISSVIRARRTAHSVKPQIVYSIIERMFPERKKIELFARNRRRGWAAWGNEI